MRNYSFSFGPLQILVFMFSTSIMLGCVYYKKNTIFQEQAATDWNATLNEIKMSRPVIQVISENKIYDLANYRFEDDKLIGTIKPAKIIYTPPEQNLFLRSRLPTEQRRPILLIMQLFTLNDMNEGEVEIPISELGKVQYYQGADGASTLATLALTGVLVVGGAAVFLAIACSCPRVYTVNENGEKVRQGTILTGAMSKSFERTDLLPLYDLDRTGESIKVGLSNELPEDEFIDELKLLKASKKAHTQLAVNADGELFEYNPSLATPVSATSLDGRDISAQIEKADEIGHFFDDQLETKELNSAIFTFDKKELTNSEAKLVVRARQTELLEYSAEYAFSLFGDEFDKMYEQMEKRSREKYERRNSQKGIAMNAYIRSGKSWEKVGSYHYASFLHKKWLGLDLDLSRVEGETVEIKLESAYKFWELDYVGIATDWENLTNYEEVALQSAINEKGEDISALIAEADENYAVQRGEGTSIDLTFANSAKENEVYVLKGTGYYKHVRNYAHKANKKQLLKLKAAGPMAGQEVSKTIDLYLQAVGSR